VHAPLPSLATELEQRAAGVVVVVVPVVVDTWDWHTLT
jgi:hypothetical protein